MGWQIGFPLMTFVVFLCSHYSFEQCIIKSVAVKWKRLKGCVYFCENALADSGLIHFTNMFFVIGCNLNVLEQPSQSPDLKLIRGCAGSYRWRWWKRGLRTSTTRELLPDMLCKMKVSFVIRNKLLSKWKYFLNWNPSGQYKHSVKMSEGMCIII